jgi:hypothetical protein
MISLSDAVKRAGFTLCYLPSFSAAEISGEGDWERLVRDCRHIVKRTGFVCVDIVIRYPSGERIDYSIGMAGIQVGPLPWLAPRRKPMSIGVSGYIGVKPRMSQIRGLRWLAEVCKQGYYKYVGMYDTALDAAHARDEFISSHHLRGCHPSIPIPKEAT